MPIVTACSQDCPDTCSLVVETSPSGRVSINGNPQVDRFFKPTIGRDILAAEPAVKMIWAKGTSPVNQSPDSHRVSRAFRSVPFKVVVDAFMTDTAERADLILPSMSGWETRNHHD